MKPIVLALIITETEELKNSLRTSLDNIFGIGPKTVDTLISHFGSVKHVLEAKEDELTKLVGKRKAHLILERKKILNKPKKIT